MSLTSTRRKCKECGACAKVCPYTAIISRKRPCENACKIKAIHMNEDKAAAIDNEKCISCGACVYQCPFGAIMDKSFILDAIDIIKKSENNEKYKVYARRRTLDLEPVLRMPSSDRSSPDSRRSASIPLSRRRSARIWSQMRRAAELVEKGFLTSSCCPAFVSYIEKSFPDMVQYVSHNLSPMATHCQVYQGDRAGLQDRIYRAVHR